MTDVPIIRGSYPYAVLHMYKTKGFRAAAEYAIRVSKEKLSPEEAKRYVRDVIKTNGRPDLIDLVE